MPSLQGTICVNKRVRQHPIWQRPDYGWAWIDVLLLANDQPRTVHINGAAVPVKRGQLAWSLRTLEREWNRSGEWIRHFIDFCRDNGMVKVDSDKRRTIITVINYDVYNPQTVTEPDTDTVTEPASIPGTEAEQKVERGTEEREGGRATPPNPVIIPTDAEIAAFCDSWAGDIPRGIPATIPAVWYLGWVAAKLQDEKKWPRDWQRALVSAFRSDFLNRHPKALANVSSKPPAGINSSAPVSASVEAIQRQKAQTELQKKIRDLEEELHQDRLSNLPRDPDKHAQVRKLRAELVKISESTQ